MDTTIPFIKGQVGGVQAETPVQQAYNLEEWMTPESLQDIAQILEIVAETQSSESVDEDRESIEDLKGIRASMPPEALKAAANLLPKPVRSRIAEMVRLLNSQEKKEKQVYQLSQEDREDAKQAVSSSKTQPMKPAEDTPPIENLIELPDSTNSSQNVSVDGWKRHDQAIYLGEPVWVFEVNPEDGSIIVLCQNGEKVKVEKLLLFKPE